MFVCPAEVSVVGSRAGGLQRLIISEQRAPHLEVLIGELSNELGGGLYVGDGGNSLTGTPNVLPRLGVGVSAGAPVHGRWVGDGEVVWVEASGEDGAAQVVGVNPGEQVGVDDVRRGACCDHVLIALGGVGFVGGQEG